MFSIDGIFYYRVSSRNYTSQYFCTVSKFTPCFCINATTSGAVGDTLGFTSKKSLIMCLSFCGGFIALPLLIFRSHSSNERKRK